jgi:predicted metalloprotease
MRIGRRGGMSLGTLVIAAVVMYFLGIDPSVLLTGGGPASVQSPSSPGSGSYEAGNRASAPGGAADELADFVSVVLGDTEDTWHTLFGEAGQRYEEPTLVLFSGFVQSACGMAQSAMGPFYCPADRKVYIDLAFYDEMRRNFGASGDFAQAYVIAHEVGHHVQTLVGTSEKVMRARRGLSETDGNRLSVMQELQADCFAGVWANHAHVARKILEAGDVEEGLNAAAAIGDDRLQRQSQGYVVPDAFTHGSSAQRVRWFKRGLSEGSVAACDTFSADEL